MLKETTFRLLTTAAAALRNRGKKMEKEKRLLTTLSQQCFNFVSTMF
jgi:hypothetical protein